MEMRDPGTIAGGRPPALLRQGKTKQRPETHESLDTGRMGLTMRGKETQNKGWDVKQRPGEEQSKCSIKQRCYSHLFFPLPVFSEVD